MDEPQARLLIKPLARERNTSLTGEDDKAW